MNILGYELHKSPPLGAFTGVWNHGVTAPAGRQIRDMSIEQLRIELAWVREQAVAGLAVVISRDDVLNRVVSLPSPLPYSTKKRQPK